MEGIKYLHSQRILHRDIKLDNIIVNFKAGDNNLLNSEIKIIDFGLSKQLSLSANFTTSIRGNHQNMDPRLLEEYFKKGTNIYSQGYNEKSDIWSLGAICYEMLTGKPLFNSEYEFMNVFIKEKKYKIPINIDLSNEIILFLTSMLQYNPVNRASAEELLKSDFLTKNSDQFTPLNYQILPLKIENEFYLVDFIQPSIINRQTSLSKSDHNRILIQGNNNYELINEIGVGAFGKVFLTRKKDQPNSYFATKVINIKNIPNQGYLKYLNSEIELLKRLNNNYIIHMYDYFKTTENYYIIMEYCNGKTLLHQFKEYRKENNNQPFPQDLIQYFMRQIIEGIKYLHSQKIIHRDLKLDNILSWNIKYHKNNNNSIYYN